MKIHGAGIPRPASTSAPAAATTIPASTSDGARSGRADIGATLAALTKPLHADDSELTRRGETRTTEDSVLSAPHDATVATEESSFPYPPPRVRLAQ